MTKSSTRFIFLGLSLTALLLTIPGICFSIQQYDALLGEWDAETEGAQYTFVFKFFTQEGKLAGTFEGQGGEVEMEDLAFADNKVTFTVEIDAGGQTMSINFEATIDGENNLEGFLSMEFGEASITGTKRK
jgi:polyisoprenoid-binding protein YceI